MTRFNHQDGEYVEVDGARLYVEQQGNLAGPPLIFVPGGFGEIEVFNKLTPTLGRTHRLIGIDSRGHGKSTLGPHPLSYRRLAQDVAAVASHLQLARYSVLGHSDGAIVALRLAADPANPIDRIIPIGAHGDLADDDPVRRIFGRVTGDYWRERFPESHASYQRLNPEPDFDRFALIMQRLWSSSDADGYPGESIRHIGCEVLIVHGDADPLVKRNHLLYLMANLPTSAKLLCLPFVEHEPHEECPALILPAIERFLNPG
ncbi:MAG: alpha/beta hydrolase [Lautropia sp.]|nr:alpha/beta hydrolase [Lautropia sp.]